MRFSRGGERRGRSGDEISKRHDWRPELRIPGPSRRGWAGGHRCESGGRAARPAEIIGQSQNPSGKWHIRFLFAPYSLYRIEQEHFSAKQSPRPYGEYSNLIRFGRKNTAWVSSHLFLVTK